MTTTCRAGGVAAGRGLKNAEFDRKLAQEEVWVRQDQGPHPQRGRVRALEGDAHG